MTIFGTAGIRGPVTESVTPEFCLSVGRAVGQLARDNEIGPVMVGRDGRVTGSTLSTALRAGLSSAGTDVQTLGEVPTPALAFASQNRIGIMLTASHNPPQDNGIKLFRDGAEFDRSNERDVEQRLEESIGPDDWAKWGTTTKRQVISHYQMAVHTFARNRDLPLSGLDIVIDCGNGMSAYVAPQVLYELGANVTALNANIDGRFPARESKPTEESLADLRRFVADSNADLGYGFDGDADRIAVVAPDGSIVHEDTVLAILAEYYVDTSRSEDPVVVTTPNASSRIDERVSAAGGSTIRVPLGSIAQGLGEQRSAGKDVAFAAEPWKHIHPLLGDWIDAIASAAVFGGLAANVGGVRSLKDPVTEWPYLKSEVRCPDRKKDGVLDRLETVLPERYPEASASFEFGIRLEFPNGFWTMVRPSGTEPYVRVYVEGDNAEQLLEEITSIIEETV